MANTYLTRTPSSASNRTTWTWSAWIKLSALGTPRNLFGAYAHAADNLAINIADTDTVSIRFYNNTEYQLGLNRVFRDTSAWYHLVFAIDTTLATEADRFIIYVNGVRETSFQAGANSQPTQNLQMTINEATATQIGRFNTGSYFDGSMSHIHFIDGTAYDASAFGETDATTGEWEAKTSPSVTYGTNGFFILKDGNGITDQSGEGNDFTLGGGTLTDLKDNPDNVFATMNPLDNFYAGSTFSNGNNSVNQPDSKETYNTSTLGFASLNSGKYYCEVKATDASDYTLIGIASRVSTGATETLNSNGLGNGYAYDSQAGIIRTNGGVISGWTGSTYTNGDIIGVAVDTDNLKLYFSKNGVWQNSANPSSGTGSAAITSTSASNTGVFLFAGGNRHNDNTLLDFNFGNGYFGTTAVTTNSGNGYEGAEGASKFNYTVPTGYSALSTKGLNE